MKVTISKRDFNKVVSREFNKLVVESYNKKDYKTLRELYVLQTGDRNIDEGKFSDFLRGAKEKVSGAASAVKQKVSSIGQKASNIFAGIKDIGLGTGTTILGGEETLDIEKRKEKLSAAKAKVESWFTKLPAQNPLVSEIKELYLSLDKSGFPNVKDRAAFDSQTNQILSLYKKIVDGFEKGPKGEADAKAANVLISVLRGIVIYFQDYRIADTYIYMKEQAEPTAEVPGPDAEEPVGSAEGEGSKSAAAAYSKKLPAGLAIGGAALLAMGYGAKSKGFQDALLSMRDMSKATDPKKIADGLANYVVNQVDVNAGDGITQAINAMHGLKAGDPGFLGPNAPISELMKYKDDLETLKQALQNQAGGAPVIDKIINGEIPGATKLGEFFKGTISGKGGSLLAINKGSFARTASKQIYKYVAGEAAKPLNTVKNSVIGKLALMSGPVLTALGLSFLGGAVASAGLRLKGSVSSRMNDLRQVVVAMPDVKAGGGTQAVPVPKAPVAPAGSEPTAEVPGPNVGPGATAKIPGSEPSPGATAKIPGGDEPTIVDPSMQPTVIDPEKQKTGVEEIPTKPGGIEPTVNMFGPDGKLKPEFQPQGQPEEEIEGGEDVTPPEGPDELEYAVSVFNKQSNGELGPKDVTVDDAEKILRIMGVSADAIDAHLSPDEPAAERRTEKPMMMAKSKIKTGLKENLVKRNKKRYNVKELIDFGKTYLQLERMKKLAGIIKD